MSLEKTVELFINKHYENNRPVLLALSGGPDSIALFHLLLKSQEKKYFPFAVAHIDHGWREESAKEASILEELMKQHNIDFHLKKLNPKEIKGNLEDACREARFAFYQELTLKYNYQAVILGHHEDDQMETVLKRVFEGSSILKLKGMSERDAYKNLHLWRPLIHTSKKQISEWLEKQNIHPFIDKTNFDDKYLRARLRSTIIPDLSKSFGKEIKPALVKISLEAKELQEYLEFQLKDKIDSILSGPFGSCFDFTAFSTLHPVEIKFLIRKVCEKEGLKFSHALLEEAFFLIQNRVANKELANKTSKIHVDRGRLFVLKADVKEFSYAMDLTNLKIFQGPWTVHVCNKTDKKNRSKWQEAWLGRLYVTLPKATYSLAKADTSISKWLGSEKVPAFLKYLFPVVYQNQQIIHEFLTGRYLKSHNLQENDEFISITIQFI